MKKIRLSILLLVLSLALIFAGCGAKDLTQGKTGNEIMLASTEAMNEVQSYKFAMNFDMNLPELEAAGTQSIAVTGSGAASINPIKTYIDLTMKMGEMSIPTELYLIMDDSQIVEYIKNPMMPSEWMKIAIPIDENMKDLMDPANSLKITKELLSNVEIVGEETIDDVDNVILDVSIKASALAQTMQLSSSPGLSLEQIENDLATLGDIKFKTWIRKDNLYTTKIEMDLGSLLKNIFSAQTTGIPASELAQFQNISAQLNMTFFDFDKPVDITVPEEVKNNAIDLSSQLPPGSF